MQRFYIFFLTAILLGVASACADDRQRDFPNVAFEEIIYLNNPSNLPLQNIGGAVFHPGGYEGLIVFRRFANGGFDDFAAYDRGCPEHYREECGILEFSDDGTFAVCPCGDEKYLLFDGSPGEKASVGLIEYPARYDGSVVVVRN